MTSILSLMGPEAKIISVMLRVALGVIESVLARNFPLFKITIQSDVIKEETLHVAHEAKHDFELLELQSHELH